MDETQAYDIISDTVLVVLLASAPVLGVALVIGLVIAFFQALTQIQEVTLTFVPKILAIFVVIAMTASFTGAQVYAFTQESYSRIETGFTN